MTTTMVIVWLVFLTLWVALASVRLGRLLIERDEHLDSVRGALRQIVKIGEEGKQKAAAVRAEIQAKRDKEQS